MQEYHEGGQQEHHELVRGRDSTWTTAKNKVHDEARESGDFKPLQSALSRSLEQDELLEQNPFAHLSNLDPIQEIMRKGVMTFHREVFRSPNYKSESGYDIISYVVEHTDSTQSTILAYLESDSAHLESDSAHLESDSTQTGEQEKVPFVVFMVSNAAKGSTYSFYRGGALVEQSQLTTGEASAFVAQRLKNGIPFLSVAR